MKKIIFMIASIAIISACSFAGTPPAAVKKTFVQKFPTATNVHWGKENDKEWEAEFKQNGVKLSANFTNAGEWVETEKEITYSELPKPVTEAIKKQFPNWKITEMDKTETAKFGTIYEADLKSGKQKKAVAFKDDGTTVNE